MSELVISKMSVAQLRKVLTERGKMKMTNEEVDDLIKKVSPESLERLGKKFRWRRWGSSLPGLRILDPPLSPPSTPDEIFRRTFLGGG